MLLLILLPSAQAWRPNGVVWTEPSIPIHVEGAVVSSFPALPNEESGRLYQEDLSLQALCNWRWSEGCESLPSDWPRRDSESCAYVGGALLDIGEEPPERHAALRWGDPDELLGAGVYMVISHRRGDAVGELAGETLYEVEQAELTFNDDVLWLPSEALGRDCPEDGWSAEAMATVGWGQLLGLGPACELGEDCSDYADTTMGRTLEPCDLRAATPAPDDLAGLEALYGAPLSPSAAPTLGGLPLEVCFNLESAVDLGEARLLWDLGDGQAAEGLAPCHVYTEEGSYTVSVTVEGAETLCGPEPLRTTLPEPILACAPPAPDFSVEPLGERRWQVVNNTPVLHYGCLDALEFALLEGDAAQGEPLLTLSAWAPELELPDEGDYTLRLTASGPGGEASAEVSLGGPSGGCSTAPGGGDAGWLALALLLRRRGRSRHADT
ncbi:MAG: PKD domain-containing protein [Alphaproteobacteria bacterium]|nr:PKD domain-containing protein [Alphaproteobacteria bacterium]